MAHLTRCPTCRRPIECAVCGLAEAVCGDTWDDHAFTPPTALTPREPKGPESFKGRGKQ